MSDNLPSIIDIGKLSEPATKLIEKAAEGMGGFFAPWQTKRMAKRLPLILSEQKGK